MHVQTVEISQWCINTIFSLMNLYKAFGFIILYTDVQLMLSPGADVTTQALYLAWVDLTFVVGKRSS